MRKAWIVTALVAACLLQPLSAAALAMASSSITFNNLSITPASGSLTMLDPWTLTAFAEANNSLGESDDDFAFDLSPGQVNAAASVTWAAAAGAVSAPIEPLDFVVAGSAASEVDIPGCSPAAAFSKGIGTLSTVFELTGGTGAVDVAFGIDIAGVLKVMTDHCGLLAATETIFTLEVDGTPVLFDRRELSVGPNSSFMETFSLRLLGLAALDFDVPHILVIEADSESEGLVAEPPVMAMLLIGAVALAVARRRRRDGL